MSNLIIKLGQVIHQEWAGSHGGLDRVRERRSRQFPAVLFGQDEIHATVIKPFVRVELPSSNRRAALLARRCATEAVDLKVNMFTCEAGSIDK